MHGPCGRLNPKCVCMNNGKCIKHYPRSFNESTMITTEGYPVYRRRDNGRTVKIGNAILDNC